MMALGFGHCQLSTYLSATTIQEDQAFVIEAPITNINVGTHQMQYSTFPGVHDVQVSIASQPFNKPSNKFWGQENMGWGRRASANQTSDPQSPQISCSPSNPCQRRKRQPCTRLNCPKARHSSWRFLVWCQLELSVTENGNNKRMVGSPVWLLQLQDM